MGGGGIPIIFLNAEHGGKVPVAILTKNMDFVCQAKPTCPILYKTMIFINLGT